MGVFSSGFFDNGGFTYRVPYSRPESCKERIYLYRAGLLRSWVELGASALGQYIA